MTFKHGFGHNINNPKHRLSSSIDLDPDPDPEFNQTNFNNSPFSTANGNFHTYSVPLSSNKNQAKGTRKRSNSKIICKYKPHQEVNVKLQSFNTSFSLPDENDLLDDQSSDSDFQREEFNLNGDHNSETTKNNPTLDKGKKLDEQIDNNGALNDSACQKKWKKIFSKMFFYDNKESNIKKLDYNKTENHGADDFHNPKELYVLMNKKETKKLMKMRSNSKYHKRDTLSVLASTKGNIVKKFKNNVFHGVPDSLRGTVWQTIIDPFHSFCIKLKPEVASLINSQLNINSIENTSSNTAEKKIDRNGEFSCQINDFSVNEDKNGRSFENNIESIDNSNSNTLQSTFKQNPHQNLDSNTNDSSRSIEYVKVNLHTNQNLVHFFASRAKPNIIKSIEGDVGRTLVQFKKMRNPLTQLSLKNCLAAYSVVDCELGYTQGMGFIAAILLLYMDENSSFNCFCNLMLSKRFGFRSLFVNGFPRIQMMNKVWCVALQSYFPHIERKLAQSNIEPIVYTFGWWIANFLNFPLPDDILLLLFDRYLLFGSMSLISFGLTIFGVCKEYLEKSSIDEMISLLQMPSNFPKMLDSKEVIFQWNNNFWISKKNYAKLLKKANVSFLP